MEPKNINSLTKEFDAVYSYLRNEAPEEIDNFFDFSEIFDECMNCYIDFSHTGPQGNRIIAENLIKMFNFL